ncbi:MAG: hypothetical protein ACW986_05150 [Promethearchaeota archaeon]
MNRFDSIFRAGDRSRFGKNAPIFSVSADVSSLAISFRTRYYLQPSTLTTELGRAVF